LALLGATAGGFVLFLWLAPRRRGEPPEPAPETAPEPPVESPPAVARRLPEYVATAPNVLPDEVDVPRWLRQSVRTGRGLEPPRRRDL
jgi:hypothetical protein